MAKPKKPAEDEILVLPFLDVMCTLIGVLVLIIVFLVVSQTQQSEGMTQEEVDRALEHNRLQRELTEQRKTMGDLAPMLEKLEELEKEIEIKGAQVVNLRKLVADSAQAKELSLNALKQLDDLLLEIEGYENESKILKTEIDKLKAEIAERNLKNDTPPPVVVQPSGSGSAEEGKTFFIEASGGRIVVYWDEQRRSQISSAAEVIIASDTYDAFLRSVKEVPNSKLVFLVRNDGMGSFNNAAGWAQQTHEFAPEQLARLPLPGRGAVDLENFRAFMGTVEPPEGVDFLPPDPQPVQAPN